MLAKKQPRAEILYARIQHVNAEWIKAAMRKWNYKSKSEFIDCLLADLQVMYPLKNGKKPSYDCSKSVIFRGRKKAKSKGTVRARH